MVTVYSIWLMLTTLAFWFVRVENFGEVFYAFYETGRFPVTIYNRWLRLVLTYVVPIAFLTTFPAATLLGKLSPYFVLGSVVIAADSFLRVVTFLELRDPVLFKCEQLSPESS